MIVKRLTTVHEVIKLWDFIRQGLRVIEEKNHDKFDDDAMLKTCNFLVKRPDVGYIAVVLNDDEEPVCFAILQEATPLFVKDRSFIALAVYHNHTCQQATLILMDHFENWARSQGIGTYVVSTKRQAGAAIRCFERKYGFKRGFITFEKKL